MVNVDNDIGQSQKLTLSMLLFLGELKIVGKGENAAAFLFYLHCFLPYER